MTAGNKGRIPASKGAARAGTRALGATKKPKQGKESQDPQDMDDKESGPEEDAGQDQEQSEAPSPPEQEAETVTHLADDTIRHPFGVRRLDDLLDGGLEERTFTLLYGPPFLGKENLSRRLVIEALGRGVPAIIIHTDATADQVVERMEAMGDGVAEARKKGLLQLVDCYTRPIEAKESTAPHVHYVDGPNDLNGLNLAINGAQRKLQADHDHHILVIDSLSTIIAYANAQTAFRFLHVLLGKSRNVGATALVLLDEGMHSSAEVQTFRHLMTGSLDVRDHTGKYQLKVLGIGNQEGLGWIDYRYHRDQFRVTGSFAPGRIR